MKTLRVDEKWGIEYDPENNDRPMWWVRHGAFWKRFEENNPTVAMFYALLAKESQE